MNKNIRYQDCPWYIKLWRRRYYLLVPINALRFYIFYNLIDKNDLFSSFRTCWGFEVGLAQCKMNWVYDCFLKQDVGGNYIEPQLTKIVVNENSPRNKDFRKSVY